MGTALLLGRVCGFEEKPDKPVESLPGNGRGLASMGIYLFRAGFLFDVLCRDAIRLDSRHDFGGNIIPRILDTAKVTAYVCNTGEDARFYWRDAGTLESFYEANRDLLGENPAVKLFDKRWPVRTAAVCTSPAQISGRSEVSESRISAGNLFAGSLIRRSILGPACQTGEGCRIDDSILFPNVRIGKEVRLRRTILDRGCTVSDGERIGFQPELDRQKGFFVSESGITVVSRPAAVF